IAIMLRFQSTLLEDRILFFSSRRRHTRSKRDWSSDVCSSDLKKKFNEDEFRNDMDKFGDSLLVINDDEIVKVHVHTNRPGEALTYGAEYGEIIKTKIENMREQFRDLEAKRGENKKKEAIKTAIIAVSSGEGIDKLLKSIGVTHLISGGQTMNPSTEDIVNIIKDENVEEVIIMPNNKNIIMAAE